MTEKEFDQIRNSYYGRKTDDETVKERGGYFSYFKIRCFLCMIIFISILILDKQVDFFQYDFVKESIQCLGKEDLTIQECFRIFNPMQ